MFKTETHISIHSWVLPVLHRRHVSQSTIGSHAPAKYAYQIIRDGIESLRIASASETNLRYNRIRTLLGRDLA